MSEGLDWDPIRLLARRTLEQGEALVLSEETHALLRKSAREVAIGAEDIEDALRSVSTATTLLREIDGRIREGSRRLMHTLDRTHRRRDKGDMRGARKLLEELLAVEVVPLYRAQAEHQLEELARLEAIAATGHVDDELPPWEQLPVLSRRVEQGHGLELTNELRDFLRCTASTVAIHEAEAETALESMEGAAVLLRMMLGRIRDGEHRITEALFRMTSLRDAGDLEGARQQMRDVLAVEVVPLYREMAEENLAGLDEPPPET